MRILLSTSLLGALALTTGCSSTWELRGVTVITCATEKPFFRDEDEDGWGADPEDYVEACAAGEVDGYTVRNARDCNDDDPDIGAKTGAVCPVDLVLGGNDAVGVPGSDFESVAVVPPSDRVTSGAAAQACASGWGGELMVLQDAAQWSALREAVDRVYPSGEYAAFLALSSDGTDWVWPGSGIALTSMTPCSVELPDASEAGPTVRLAAVREASGEWCLGLPSDAGGVYDSEDEPVAVRDLYAHFACRRAKPDPVNYREPPLDDASE